MKPHSQSSVSMEEVKAIQCTFEYCPRREEVVGSKYHTGTAAGSHMSQQPLCSHPPSLPGRGPHPELRTKGPGDGSSQMVSVSLQILFLLCLCVQAANATRNTALSHSQLYGSRISILPEILACDLLPQIG